MQDLVITDPVIISDNIFMKNDFSYLKFFFFSF